LHAYLPSNQGFIPGIPPLPGQDFHVLLDPVQELELPFRDADLRYGG
jgi:hypothetical protein